MMFHDCSETLKNKIIGAISSKWRRPIPILRYSISAGVIVVVALGNRVSFYVLYTM